MRAFGITCGVSAIVGAVALALVTGCGGASTPAPAAPRAQRAAAATTARDGRPQGATAARANTSGARARAGTATGANTGAGIQDGGEASGRADTGISPAVVLAPSGHPAVTVRVELALTEAARERGLMFRRHLDPNAGMLFVYGAPEPQSFWMKNTYIPLDMIFIGGDRRVVGVVANAAPLTTDAREVDAPSQYVLEVNGGFAARHGIGVGTLVRLQNVSRVIEPEEGSAGARHEEDRDR